MQIRQDGEATRRRILQAACAVFGEKGFDKSTHAEIARRAKVNSALINFHYRSKDALYKAAWAHLSAQAEARWPHDGGVAKDRPAAERLRAHIRSLLHRAADPAVAGLHRLIMMESANPTGLLVEPMREQLRRYRDYTQGIVRELLGPKASEEAVIRCEMSIILQTRVLRADHPRHAAYWKPLAANIEALVDHITTFSLAGIAAVRGQRKQKVSK